MFAITVILRDIHERASHLSCQFILRRARQSVSYVHNYFLHLSSVPVSAEEREEMKRVEEELSYEELAVLRRVAMQRVMKERAQTEVCAF